MKKQDLISGNFMAGLGSPYKTVLVNNLNRLHVITSGSTWRKIRCLQSNKSGYFQTCIALQGLPKNEIPEWRMTK